MTYMTYLDEGVDAGVVRGLLDELAEDLVLQIVAVQCTGDDRLHQLRLLLLVLGGKIVHVLHDRTENLSRVEIAMSVRNAVTASLMGRSPRKRPCS